MKSHSFFLFLQGQSYIFAARPPYWPPAVLSMPVATFVRYFQWPLGKHESWTILCPSFTAEWFEEHVQQFKVFKIFNANRPLWLIPDSYQSYLRSVQIYCFCSGERMALQGTYFLYHVPVRLGSCDLLRHCLLCLASLSIPDAVVIRRFFTLPTNNSAFISPFYSAVQTWEPLSGALRLFTPQLAKIPCALCSSSRQNWCIEKPGPRMAWQHLHCH